METKQAHIRSCKKSSGMFELRRYEAFVLLAQ